MKKSLNLMLINIFLIYSFINIISTVMSVPRNLKID